ncbi:hypothetical protein QFC19_001881 [Naganishia cerealis]|uniref:Uncharacterized protein n=1 Tax=Naganishia cerealis TaxID=610337 RepID=A0ACC2WGD7_9TREE|nr:hypothetical protein QFC19_001881 [Naganishia cerealis]
MLYRFQLQLPRNNIDDNLGLRVALTEDRPAQYQLEQEEYLEQAIRKIRTMIHGSFSPTYPMLFQELMVKLSHSLTETINAIKDETPSGIGGVGRALISKFEAWRDEVDGLRKGQPVDAPEGQGGVEMSSESGLYTD